MNSKLSLLSFAMLALLLTSAMSEEVSISVDNDANQYQIKHIKGIDSGFVKIPLVYINQHAGDYYFLPALRIGSQYAASQAVSEGHFSNSTSRVGKILKFLTKSSSEGDAASGTDSAAQYIFQVTLISLSNEVVRAHFVVLVDQLTNTFQVISNRFVPIKSTDEVAQTSQDAEWVQVNVTKALRYGDFNSMLRYGAKFAIAQGCENQDLYIPESTFFKVSNIHSVYKRKVANGVQYKFDVDLLAEYIQELRVNFQVTYNAAKGTLNLDSWAIKSSTKIIVDMLG